MVSILRNRTDTAAAWSVYRLLLSTVDAAQASMAKDNSQAVLPSVKGEQDVGNSPMLHLDHRGGSTSPYSALSAIAFGGKSLRGVYLGAPKPPTGTRKRPKSANPKVAGRF